MDPGDVGRLAELQRQLSEDEKGLDDAVTERYVLRTMDSARYENVRAILQERIVSARESLEAASRQKDEATAVLLPGDRSALDAWWKAATIEDQRAAVRQVVHRIDVLPAARKGAPFHPDRIHVRGNWSAYLLAADAFGDTPEGRAEYDRLQREAEREPGDLGNTRT